MKNFDYIVIGAGLTGCTFARQKAEQGHRVLIYDRRDHIAGNAYDHQPHGAPMMIHQYGPHLFHTNSQKVWDFLSLFTEWRPYQHRVHADVWLRMGTEGPNRSVVVPLPFNFTSIRKCFPASDAEIMIRQMEEHWNLDHRITLRQLKLKAEETGSAHLIKLHDYVYSEVFAPYTQKMWGMSLEELGPAVADRVPLVAGNDDRYFADEYQAMPVLGYTEMCRRMLNHRLIELRLGVKHVPEQWAAAADHPAKVFNTGSIDAFFNYQFGKLPYRGMDFHHSYYTMDNGYPPKWEREWTGDVQAPSTINYPSDQVITRVSSMSRILGLPDGDSDIRTMESPTAMGQFYPIPTRENREQYDKYRELAEQLPNIRFGGRMGSYQYLNLDQAVAQALKIAEEF